MSTRTLKVGVVGAGKMGTSHISALSNLHPLFEITGIYDPNPQVVEKAIEKFNLNASVYSNYQELLESGIDFVTIISPHKFHCNYIIKAIKAGVHILCEKPLCLTLDELVKIYQAHQETQSKVKIAVGHNKLSHAMVQKAKSLLLSGRIGSLQRIFISDEWHHQGLHSDILTARENGQTFWRAVAELMGRGGILWDTSMHSFSLALYFALSDKYRIIGAHVSRDYLEHFDGYDTLDALILFDNNVLASIRNSWAHTPTSTIINGWNYQEPLFRLMGTKGVLTGRIVKNTHDLIEHEELTIEDYENNFVTSEALGNQSTLRTQYRQIHSSITNGGTITSDLEHARQVIFMADHLYDVVSRQQPALVAD